MNRPFFFAFQSSKIKYIVYNSNKERHREENLNVHISLSFLRKKKEYKKNKTTKDECLKIYICTYIL